MSENAPSLSELEAIALAQRLSLSQDRLLAILPEVQRLWEQAQRIRALPLEHEEPAVGFSLR